MDHFEITHLGHQGDGVSAGQIYAPLTVPGDVVTGRLEGDRLLDVKIERPSDLRVKPVCRHFKSCGGCALQHVSDAFVSDWKASVVADTLKSAGLETEIRGMLTSPAASRRLATFAARRTKSSALAGFHARASDTVIETPDCQLLRPRLLQALSLCKVLASEGASRKHGLDVTVTETENGLDFAVNGGKQMDAVLQSRLAQIAEANGLTRICWDDEVAALRTPSTVRFDGIAVPLPPGAFLQATQHGEDCLRAGVQEIVGGAGKIVDLFAGCGTFALPLARKAEVMAVEGARDMTKALHSGWRHADGLKDVQVAARDLFRNPLLPEEMRKIDAVVIDPPRAGAAAQIAEIAQSRVETVAHVSCNPKTFARDAKALVDAGFALKWVQPVDQFRWSPHIELVGAFYR